MTATLEKATVVKRLQLDDMCLSTGKRARLQRLLYGYGPGNGSLLLLPIDQGLEHGPVDFFVNPPCANPEYQLQLALNGGYSGIVFHIGLAEKYMNAYAGKVPLVLKLNGKTGIPSSDNAFSSLTGSVEDAVRLGADAIGYTVYVGSPAQDRDIEQFNQVRQQCERYGMPIIVWAYPRGTAVDKKGGKDSLYAIDYAARVACELGADIVKINYPKIDADVSASPAPYNTLNPTFDEAVRRVVASAGRTLVLFSGGDKVDDATLLNMAQTGMDAGGTGLIFGRNMWQRPMNEALEISRKASDILRRAGQ